MSNPVPESDPTPDALCACLVSRREELLQMLICMGFPVHDAEDAAQEAILHGVCWVKNGQPFPIQNRAGWLQSAAVQLARRMRKRQHSFSSDGMCDREIRPFDELDEHEETQVVISLIQSFMKKKPPIEQQLFTFCCLEAHHQSEAAEIFNIKPVSVHRYIKRAKQSITRFLRARYKIS